MSAHDPKRGDAAAGDRRLCGRCEATLARDNAGHLCGRCLHDQRDQLDTPPAHLPNDFWETDDFRAAFRARHIGKVFKAYRNHSRHRDIFGKALNQATLGRWLGLEQSQVSRIENATDLEPYNKVTELYAEMLHIPRHLFWIVPEGQILSTYQSQLSSQRQSRLNPSPPDADDHRAIPASQNGSAIRATSLDTFGLITLGQHGTVLDPSTASRGRMPMKAELLAHYESLTNNYRQIDYQAGAGAVYGDTVTHLNRLMKIADQVSSELYGPYIALLGDTAQLAAWLAIDSQDYSTARHFCSIALSSAEEGEDPTLHSYVLGVMSYIHLHAQRGNEAVRLLDSALRIANTPRFGVSAAVRSWLFEALAEAHAFAGNHKAGIKALIDAERLFDAVRADSVPHWLGFYNSQEHVARLKGRCLLRLGDGRAAIAALESACETLPEHYVRERSGTLIDLASARLLESGKNATPEPEAAADVAQEAWRLALETNSQRNQRRVRELLPAFKPYANLEIVQSLTNQVK